MVVRWGYKLVSNGYTTKVCLTSLILIIFKIQVMVSSLMRKKSNTRVSTLFSRKRRDSKKV